MEQLNTHNILYVCSEKAIPSAKYPISRLVSEPGITTSLDFHLLPSDSQTVANHLSQLFDNTEPLAGACMHIYVHVLNIYTVVYALKVHTQFLKAKWFRCVQALF